MPADVLLAFDFPGIQRYVYASEALREVRGASALLDELNREVIPALAERLGAEVVVAAGGMGLILCDGTKADELERGIRDEVLARTDIAGVVLAKIPASRHDIEQDFAGLHRRLMTELRLNKGNPPSVRSLPSHPLFAQCQSCGEQPATRLPPGRGADTTPERLCEACHKKAERFRRDKDAMINGCWPGVWGRVSDCLAKQDRPLVGKRPEEMADLDGLGRPEGSFALIIADGDNLGHGLFEKARSRADFQRLSGIIDQALVEAVAEAIRGPLAPVVDKQKKTPDKLPFDIFYLGGDDLVIGTTGDRAFKTAHCLAQKFHGYTGQHGLAASLSVGIAIAHTKYPFGPLKGLAEGALKDAKKRRFLAQQNGRLAKGAPGLINYVLISSSSHTDFATFASEELYQEYREAPERTIHRTLRPYTPDTLNQLLKAVELAKKIPGTKLEALRATTLMDRQRGTLEGRVIYARLKSKERDAVQDILHMLANGQGVDFPWIKRADHAGVINPWLDIAELSTFTNRDEAEAGDDRNPAP